MALLGVLHSQKDSSNIGGRSILHGLLNRPHVLRGKCLRLMEIMHRLAESVCCGSSHGGREFSCEALVVLSALYMRDLSRCVNLLNNTISHPQRHYVQKLLRCCSWVVEVGKAQPFGNTEKDGNVPSTFRSSKVAHMRLSGSRFHHFAIILPSEISHEVMKE